MDPLQNKNLLQLSEAIACLRSGGVVAIPTDTVYGLAVLPSQEQGIDRLYALKERPRIKALPVMVANVDQVANLV